MNSQVSSSITNEETTMSELRDVDAIVGEVETLSWVLRVEETDREGATHRLITELSVINFDTEIHTLENCGVRVEGISQIGAYGETIYVTIPSDR